MSKNNTVGLSGAELIERERRRQIEKKGWTSDHDDGHRRFDLCRAAAVYIINVVEREINHTPTNCHVLAAAVNVLWPWESHWHKTKKDIRSNLIRTGALIAAELDRLQREER